MTRPPLVSLSLAPSRRIAKVVEATEYAKLMLDSGPLCCQIWDREYNVIDCNKAAVELYGFKNKQEYIEKWLYACSPKYQPDGQRSEDKGTMYVKKAFDEGRCVFEWMHQALDGTPLPAEITLVRVKYKDDYVVLGYTRDLREIKRMEKAVIEAEHIQILMDATPLSCILIDKNFQIIACNNASVKLFNVSSKDEVMTAFYDLAPEYQPDGRVSKEAAIESIGKAHSDGFNSCEWMHKSIDGELIPCEVTLVRVKYNDDYIVAGYTRDLRKIKEAEAKLHESDERIKVMFESTPLIIMFWDKNNNILDCNQEAIRVYGLASKEEFIARFYELAPEYQPGGIASSEMVQKAHEIVLNTGFHRFEWVHRMVNGEAIPLDIVLVRVRHDDDYAVISYAKDLRELKALLRERDTEKERFEKAAHWYESLLDALPFLVTAQDLEENFTFINATAEETFGKTRQEMIGKACSTLGLPICNTDNCAIACAKRGRMRTYFTYKDIFYQADVTPLKDLNSKRSGYIEVIQDITKMEHLARQQAEAEAASKAKSSFLAAMSHEMRTPMNAIIGMASIGKNAEDMERKDYALNKIEAASMHLLSLINDVLDMSKIEAHKIDLAHILFDLKDTVRRAVSFIQLALEEKRIQFSVNMDHIDPPLFVGDEQRLTQVIINLLSNAVKFTDEEGKISLDISLAGEECGMCALRFAVSDSGIGMSPAQRERIFTPFEQAEKGTSRKYGGTGLGLAISKHIIELMGGGIWVESEVGKGSRFIFTVKLRRDQREALPAPGGDDAADAGAAKNRLEGKKLLLAEDIEINREILIALLDGMGLTIDTAENGRDALAMVRAAPDKYDLVFMDMQMPEMDGLEATRQIRALPASRCGTLPIIALTANVFQNDIDECLAAGMNDHIGKPFDITVVLEKLLKYI